MILYFGIYCILSLKGNYGVSPETKNMSFVEVKKWYPYGAYETKEIGRGMFGDWKMPETVGIERGVIYILFSPMIMMDRQVLHKDQKQR